MVADRVPKEEDQLSVVLERTALAVTGDVITSDGLAGGRDARQLLPCDDLFCLRLEITVADHLFDLHGGARIVGQRRAGTGLSQRNRAHAR